jgi:hypothetical protein
MKPISILFLGLCFFAIPIFAQDTQLPFDRDGKYFTIDEQLENRFKLFPDYPTFREARLFQTPEDTYYIEISFMRDNRMVRDRKDITTTELESIRISIEMAEEQARSAYIDHSGRAKFIRTTVGMNLLFYGWSVPDALDMNPAAGVSYYFLSTGAAFYIPFVLTKNSSVTEPMANLSRYGAYRGAIQGFLLDQTIGGPDAGGNRYLGLGTAVSMTGLMVGYHQAKKYDYTRGQVATIGLYTDYGLVGGYLTGMSVLGLNRQGNAAVALGSSLAAYTLSSSYARNNYYTVGEVRIKRSVMLLSGLTALTLMDYTGTDNPKYYAASAVLGSGAGLYLSHKLLEPYYFSDTQGSLIWYSTVGGYAIGSGISYAVLGPENGASQVYLTLSAIGGIAGFYLLFNHFKDEARTNRTQMGSNLSVNINPMFLTMAMQPKFNLSEISQTNMSIFNIQYSF